MDYFVLAILVIMVAYIVYKNVRNISKLSNNKKYIAVCNSVLFIEDDAYQKVNDYLKEEKDQLYINKAKILKLFLELNNDLDYTDSLNDLPIKDIYFVNDKMIKDSATYNSDTFVMIMLIAIKAIMKKKNDVVESIKTKLDTMHDLDNYVEYVETLDIIDTLIDNKNPQFLFDLINGEYSKYSYEKSMVLLYKRIAAATLSYKKLGYDLYFEEDLKYFAETAVGSIVLKDYNLFDRYKVVENK